jgi:beta-1,4-N-acetylglucosaminyltransferase
MAALTGKRLFVTVGTTEFDQLIRKVDCVEFCDVLESLDFDSVCIQYGRGSYEPQYIQTRFPDVETFRFKPNIGEDIAVASLVISHAGAGSIIESLRAGLQTLHFVIFE